MAPKPKPGSAAARKRTAPGKPITDWAAVIPAICGRLANGESLRAICKSPEMPSRASVMERLVTDAHFREAYEIARAIQAETLADELIEISDDGTNDWMKVHGKNDTGWRLNSENVQRSRLRVDTRKWVLSKLLPKKYGDLAVAAAAPNEHAEELRKLRDLMLNGKPDVDPPADS
jgi:hypothetical protein